MSFPAYIHLWGYSLHPHPVFELLGYSLGFQFYRISIKGQKVQQTTLIEGVWILIGCIIGGLLGSKVLAWAESFHYFWSHRTDPRLLLSGKTIVGGLLGGWAGVEMAKYFLNIRSRTGNIYVFPLILGISIGRIGCFLSGLEDQTFGNPTLLPWGIDFGDGIYRHPTQLYDIIYMSSIALTLYLWQKRQPLADGAGFRLFMAAYLGWRVCIDTIKPHDPADLVLGLGAIQWIGLVGAGIALYTLQSPPSQPSSPS